MPLTDYSAQVTDHLLHPRNLGTLSEKDIDPLSERLLLGDAGQVARGDALRISLRVRLSGEKILDARFQNFGTGLPIAGASCLCVLLIGKTLDEAWRVSALDLDSELNGLPELKLRKPVLALLALDNAIRNFKKLPPREKNPSGDTIVCSCYQVGEGAIERAIRLHRLHTLDEVISLTRAGAGCHTCHPDLEKILARCAAKDFKVHISAEDYQAAQNSTAFRRPTPKNLSATPRRRSPPLRHAARQTASSIPTNPPSPKPSRKKFPHPLLLQNPGATCRTRNASA